MLINKDALRKEARLLLDIIDPAAGDTHKEIRGIDWEKFCRIAYCQGIREYVYIRLPESYSSFIPGHILGYLRDTYYNSILENRRLWREFKAVAVALEKRGVDFALFKGIVFNNFVYPETYTRSMQDIDILIRSGDAGKVLAILHKAGYAPARGMNELDAGDHFMEFVKSDSAGRVEYVLDVQWGEETSFIDANKNALCDVWERTMVVEKDEVKVSILSPEDMLFNLFFHQRRLGIPFNLKNILDMACIIDRYGGEIDWGFIVRRATANRVKGLTFFCLGLARELFGVECPSYVLGRIKPNILKRRLFGYFFNRILCYTGSDTGREIRVPYFVPMSALLYDRITDLVVYAGRISRRQFSRFCGIGRDAKAYDLLYRHRLFSVPVLLLLRKFFRLPGSKSN